MNVTTTISARQHVTNAERRRMYELYATYYTGGNEASFCRDLAEKDWVILLQDGNRMLGFSTQKLHRINGTYVLFSGDTVVDVAARNQFGLAGAFGHLMHHLADTCPDGDVFWFLISKGARTYRFLPTFFHDYIPAIRDNKALQALLDQCARYLFAGKYDPKTGILHFPGQKDRLISDPLREDVHSRFFRARNPRWQQGDELCCMAPLALSNLNELGRRVTNAVDPEWRTP